MNKKNNSIKFNFFKRDKTGESVLWEPSLDSLKSFYRKLILLALFLVLLLFFLFLFNKGKDDKNPVQESIASEVLRFHVIANSDSDEDQALKMEIKKAVTKSLEPVLNGVNSVKEAEKILSDNLTNIEDLANEMIASRNFSYSATALIEESYFPLKVYGDIALPPGEYNALKIELGQGEGKNWWCIMFPPLCFVDTTYSVVPDSSKEQLENLLTKEEYDSILIEGEGQESRDDNFIENQTPGGGTIETDEVSGDMNNDKVEVKAKFKILTFLNDLID